MWAIYPDTTSFYLGNVTILARKRDATTDPTISIKFDGDANELGVTPDRAVGTQYIIPAAQIAGLAA